MFSSLTLFKFSLPILSLGSLIVCSAFFYGFYQRLNYPDFVYLSVKKTDEAHAEQQKLKFAVDSDRNYQCSFRANGKNYFDKSCELHTVVVEGADGKQNLNSTDKVQTKLATSLTDDSNTYVLKLSKSFYDEAIDGTKSKDEINLSTIVKNQSGSFDTYVSFKQEHLIIRTSK